jgi:hypothetical protein
MVRRKRQSWSDSGEPKGAGGISWRCLRPTERIHF